MNSSLDEMCNKDVINVDNGARIGYVSDVEIDVNTGKICALLICKNEKIISLKKPDYLKICWSDIVVMGEDTILVKNVSIVKNEIKEKKKLVNFIFR